MRTIAQTRSRSTLALLVGTALLAVAPFGVAMGVANADGGAPGGNGGNEGVCQPQTGHLEPPNQTTKSLVYTAPAGFLISAYCVKAGSDKQGDGPHYVTLNPPVASVTIAHPSGKDISHYTVTLVKKPKPSPTTPPTTTPPTTTPPTTTPPTTTPPTTTPPTTTPPTTTPPTTTPPTTTPPTTTPPATSPATAATSPTATVTETVTVEVEGEQVEDDQVKEDQVKDKTPVEVLGEQAVVPTQVAAGLAGDQPATSSSSSQLWLAGMTGLLAAAIGLGLLSSRRTRGRA